MKTFHRSFIELTVVISTLLLTNVSFAADPKGIGSSKQSSCSSSEFASTVYRSADFHRQLGEKLFTGIIGAPNPARPTEVNRFAESVLSQVKYTIHRKNADGTTLALIFGDSKNKSRNCVWLISQDGIVARGETSEIDTHIQELVANGLGVTRYRSRNAPYRRTGNGECVSSTVEERPEEVTAEARHLRAKNALSQLSSSLFPPQVLEFLLKTPNLARLIVVPKNDLRFIPFAALPISEGGELIIDRTAVVIAPEVTYFLEKLGGGTNRSNAAEAKNLIVGDPDLSNSSDCWPTLKFAREEVKYVSQQITNHSEVLLSGEANYRTVMERLRAGESQLSLIYFATHGISNSENPIDGSRLALAEKDLYLRDVRKFRFRSSPLIVMSACQTSLGRIFHEGVFGLVEAWRYAGAGAVVSSLWNVDDEGTAELMKRFADELKSRGTTNPEYSLAAAMRSQKRSNGDPAIWAAFSVVAGNDQR